jgi:hypothetical protein
MPSAVKLMSSDGKANLSDEAYAAYEESPTETRVSFLAGVTRPLRTYGYVRPRIRVTPAVDAAAPDEPVVILTPHPHVRKKRPTNVTVKEMLSAAEVTEMLGDSTNWKLAVPNGTTTNVLTKQVLRKAWDQEASGVVTQKLRDATVGEQAVLDNAKESLSPKAGAARITSALGAPVTNVALLAAALGGFVGWKHDDIARTWLLILGVFLALLSIGIAVVASNFLKKTTVNLSRLDLLEKRSLGPPSWLINGCVALFVVAIAAVVLSVFPGKSSATASASFGEPTTSKTANGTKVAFTMQWENLGSDVKYVSISVTSAGRTLKHDVAPQEKGAVSRPISVVVSAPATFEVSTQALDDKKKPVGDEITHTYEIR